MNQIVWMSIVGIAVIAGLFFLGVCFNYLFSYFGEPSNTSRHEYLQGAAISILLSIPFWLVASGVMFKIKAAVPSAIFLSTHIVTVIVCGLFLFANIYPLVMLALGK